MVPVSRLFSQHQHNKAFPRNFLTLHWSHPGRKFVNRSIIRCYATDRSKAWDLVNLGELLEKKSIFPGGSENGQPDDGPFSVRDERSPSRSENRAINENRGPSRRLSMNRHARHLLKVQSGNFNWNMAGARADSRISSTQRPVITNYNIRCLWKTLLITFPAVKTNSCYSTGKYETRPGNYILPWKKKWNPPRVRDSGKRGSSSSSLFSTRSC